MAISLSHGGTTIFSSPTKSKDILVGTLNGVITLSRSADGTATEITHRSLTDKHISAIIQADGLLFASAFNSSIYASRDMGKTWEQRDKGMNIHNVFSLSSYKLNGKTRLFAGTEPANLFVSDDLGMSWSVRQGLREVPSAKGWTFPAPPHVAHLKHINFSVDGGKTIYASIEQGGLLYSKDGGYKWDEFKGFHDDVHRIEMHTTNPKIIYMSGGGGLYKTVDGGTNWKHLTDESSQIGGYPDQLLVHPRHPQLLFTASAESNPGTWFKSHFANSRISRSKNGGETWKALHGGLPSGMQGNVEAMALEDWGASFSLLAATTAGEIFCSDDGGETWAIIANGLPAVSKGDHYKTLIISAAR
ncbi:MAG: hypothetical protein EXR59_04880 [Dehalococcoidia bacterium]|nr:hypothetical protein [Dehalococcoidia bacterium]